MTSNSLESAFVQLKEIAQELREDRGAAITESLKRANALLGTEISIVSRIEGERYTVGYCAGGEGLNPGAEFELGQTYCSLTLQADDVMPIDHMGASEHSGHPCYAAFALETYIGAPLRVHGERYGTLSFSSSKPRPEPWSEAELQLIRVLAAWIETALEAAALKTRLQDATATLERTTRALEASNDELARFAHVASHDLQAPLRSMSAFTKLLDERYAESFDETGRQWLGYVSGAADRMTSMLRDLLAYASLGSHPVGKAPVDLTRTLQGVQAELRGMRDATQAALTQDPLPTVEGDSAQLHTLLLALMKNALLFCGEAPPQVHVSATRQGKEWVLSVRDEGIGIEPKFHSDVFEVFRRLHTRDAYPGNGIGLASVRRIAENHGGRAWLESELDKGSTFYVALPAEDEASSS